MQKVFYKDSDTQVVAGSKIRVPYHGDVIVHKIFVYGPGQWSNFSKTDEPCVVMTYGYNLDEEPQAENLAFSFKMMEKMDLVVV